MDDTRDRKQHSRNTCMAQMYGCSQVLLWQSLIRNSHLIIRVNCAQHCTFQSGLAMARMTPGRPPPEPTSIILYCAAAPCCFDNLCCAKASRAGRSAKESSMCIWYASSSFAAPVVGHSKHDCLLACLDTGIIFFPVVHLSSSWCYFAQVEF